MDRIADALERIATSLEVRETVDAAPVEPAVPSTATADRDWAERYAVTPGEGGDDADA